VTARAWKAVLARRLERHHLLRAAPRSRLIEVVTAVCGIHAQVMPSAELEIGLRVAGFAPGDLADALWQRRELAKIIGLRGTVHLVPAAEYGWWTAALAAMSREQRALDPKRLAYLGMSERELLSASDAIADALGGNELTREELGEEVARRVGRWAVDRTAGGFGGAPSPVWTAAIGHAALRGALMFGPPRGTRVTFVRPTDWLGRVAPVDPRKALRDLFVRYLVAYGPASERDFAQWAYLDVPRVRELRRELGDALAEVDVAGERMLEVAGERPSRRPATSTLLLPRFDVYAVGSYPRDVVAPPAIVAKAAATGLLPKRSGSGRAFLTGPMPVLVIDGIISGIWEAKRTARRMTIRVQPFVRLERERRAALDHVAKRIGEITGAVAELEIGAVTTRPHL